VDLSVLKLSAWTSDPKAIPKVVWLYITENEIIHIGAVANPTFGNLLLYLRKKDVLG
jgi:hypothetical protein